MKERSEIIGDCARAAEQLEAGQVEVIARCAKLAAGLKSSIVALESASETLGDEVMSIDDIKRTVELFADSGRLAIAYAAAVRDVVAIILHNLNRGANV